MSKKNKIYVIIYNMLHQDSLNEIVKFFFTLQLLNKLYHWNTSSFARHKATDSFNDKLQDNIDKFVEVIIGKYKIKPIINSIKLDQSLLTDSGIELLFNQAKQYLESLNKIIPDSEILNIRDEILADINVTLYLFALK